MPGIEPGALRLSPQTLRPPMFMVDKRSTSAHRNWGDQPDSHRHSRLHGAGCCCYIMITMELEPLVGLAPTNTSLQNSSCGF